MITKKGDFKFNRSLQKFKVEEKKIPKYLAIKTKNWFLEGFRNNGGQTDDSENGWTKRGFNRFDKKTRNTLVNKGHLRRSIKILKATWNNITVGSYGLKYSAIHNFGGKIRITRKMRMFFLAMMYEVGGGKVKIGSGKHQESKFWFNMSRHKGQTITIPKREYIGKSKKLEKIIADDIRQIINKVFINK